MEADGRGWSFAEFSVKCRIAFSLRCGPNGSMNCSEVLKAHVPPDIKHQVKMAADGEFLSEAAWIKRLVVREIRACQGAKGDGQQSCRTVGFRRPGRETPEKGGCGRPMLVRLRTEDRLLLDARAEARGMRPATYASVLLRSHLRGLMPLPKDELAVLKRAVAELGAIGRNLNQIARAANEGVPVTAPGRDEFRAILKICEALRDHTKNLIKANAASWTSGHAEPAD